MGGPLKVWETSYWVSYCHYCDFIQVAQGQPSANLFPERVRTTKLRALEMELQA